MKFHFLDSIQEESPSRIVATKWVLPSDEYLADHFPSFPVLPGVLMVETMVQAARRLVGNDRLVLGEVKTLKFGGMVRPGEGLRVEVTRLKELVDGSFLFKGVGTVLREENPGNGGGETAVAGRFIMRPLRPD